jgi:hypothetical protein
MADTSEKPLDDDSKDSTEALDALESEAKEFDKVATALVITLRDQPSN